MTFKVAMRKVRRERTWSLAVVVLLIVGLTAWMVVPSISAGLQRGMSTYTNGVATYIFVYDTGSTDNYQSRIPQNVTNEITAIPGVQNVYPIIDNFTTLLDQSMPTTLPNGTTAIIHLTEDCESAVIGGEGGYPENLISLSAGRMPENDASFLINGGNSAVLKMNQTYPIGFLETFSNNSSSQYVEFNATAVGTAAYNPMLRQVFILWNSTFLQQQLGDQLFNQTFGGAGANYFIVKVQDISQVQSVSSQLQTIFANYPGYSVVSDQADINSLQSLQSQGNVLYELIGIMSLFSVVSLVFLFTYIFSGRRKWEAGLLVTQGWSWRKVTTLSFYYYLVLGAIAATVSILIALFIGDQIGYSYQVYANTLTVPVTISPYVIISTIVIALLISSVAAYFSVWRMKEMGLDNILREC